MPEVPQAPDITLLIELVLQLLVLALLDVLVLADAAKNVPVLATMLMNAIWL
jgi:hypothetical protein